MEVPGKNRLPVSPARRKRQLKGGPVRVRGQRIGPQYPLLIVKGDEKGRLVGRDSRVGVGGLDCVCAGGLVCVMDTPPSSPKSLAKRTFRAEPGRPDVDGTAAGVLTVSSTTISSMSADEKRCNAKRWNSAIYLFISFHHLPWKQILWRKDFRYITK